MDESEIIVAEKASGNGRALRSQLNRNSKETSMIEIPISAQTDETIIWSPGGSSSSLANKLSDKEIDQFLILAKSVGTYARALDCNAFKQPSLPLSAATASRDITLLITLKNILRPSACPKIFDLDSKIR